MRSRPAAALAAAAVVGLVGCSSAPSSTPAAGPAPTTTTAARPTTTTPPPPPPPTCAQTTLAPLDLPARAAQLLVVGVPATAPASGVDLVARGVGGVFLQGRSAAPVEQVRTDVDVLRAAAGPAGLLVAVDEEGGQVQTLSGPPIGQVPSALAQAADPATLAATTRAWAGGLVAAGVDLDLAPVADVVPAGTAAGNPPIGVFDRQYGSEPGPVADAVVAVLTAMQAEGVLATAKHFPGLGRVDVNTDTAVGASDPVTTADDPALVPFRAAVDAGVAAVMVSSALYPRIDPVDLAVFSEPVITGLLRGDLGFDGLVITDDVGAAAAVAGVAPGQRAERFVAAGGDAVLTVAASDITPMTDALVARAQADPAFRGRLDEAAGRVLAAKERAGVLAC